MLFFTLLILPAPFSQAEIETDMFCHRCYAHALKLMPEVASRWYDLGLNYYHQASLTQNDQNSPAMDIEKAQQVICRTLYNIFALFVPERGLYLMVFLSLQCLKKAIMMDSSNHSYWNALGVVSMNKGNDILR